MPKNIVHHYGTWFKKHAREVGRNRTHTLELHGFEGTPYTVEKDLEHSSPIQFARDVANRYTRSDEFDCDEVHIVLLDCKGMDGNTGYRLYRKLIKAEHNRK